MPVEAIDTRTLPCHYVESAVFTTTFADRVAVLLDQVRVVEVAE